MLICKNCHTKTNFTFRGICLYCQEEGIKPNNWKKAPLIEKNNGENQGKACYLDYLKASNWNYAQDFLKNKNMQWR